MNNDNPEPEVLNLEETLTCCRISATYLGRGADQPAAAVNRLTDLIRLLLDLIEPDF